MIPKCGEVAEIKSFVKYIDPDSHFDGSALIIIRFKSGATAEIFCSIQFDSPLALDIYGNKKNAVGVDLANSTNHGKLYINGEPLIYEKENLYVAQLNDFSKSILEKTNPEVSLSEGLRNVENLLEIFHR